ncbi:hypothetical protein [Fusobacterium varium]|uniref:hypothetical protein n=1 Tax=Fusobacterium varium TaxID=856 RepID=UPI001F29BC6B|nr:hypothetical protein [Fusobacterium varium]MCF2673651.1 hypothetical protein [Fusobacterium varium]MCI6033638.1 hypothetical protein [Fusobacterium varium]MDY4004967.1 hypothetical protein [Fusobacterium varium]
MAEFNVFITFDLTGTNTLYDEFYEETEKIGFSKYIPAKYVYEKRDLSLPNTTIFSHKIANDSSTLRDDIRSKINNIYQKIGARGKFIVIISQNWGTNVV